jgi:hypothetical protein
MESLRVLAFNGVKKRRRKTEEGARRGFCGGEGKDVGLEGGRAVNKDAGEVKPSHTTT